ncbi:MAG: hypothetical protein ACOCVC_05325 [Spirochaeta sp.]
MKKRRLSSAAAVAGIVLLAAGCSVNQQMDIQIDGSGDVQLVVELSRVFREYYRDLSGSESIQEDAIFDTDEIGRVLAGQQGLTVESVAAPGPGRLEVAVQLQNIEQLYRDDTMNVPEIIRFVRSDEGAALHIRVGRNDIPRFLRLSPIGDSPVVEYLLPPGNSLSRDDYIEYLSWALEEYEEDVPVQEVIESAAIELRIQPEGSITRQHGGEVQGDTVVFRIPLIDLVLARQPLEFSVEFRAE